MQKISPLHYQNTSVSLPTASYRRVKAARLILRRHGVVFSESEMYNRLFKYYLKNWRGRGQKSVTLRRYNADGKDYVIRPLYVNQVIYSAMWQRAIHSGESVSRMLDLVIRVYLPRFVETFLRKKTRLSLRNYDIPYWAARHERRPKKYADFFINYQCVTADNTPDRLDYRQEANIISKKGLFAMEILHIMRTAA